MVSLKKRDDLASRTSASTVILVYGTWSFLASALIFWVELMVAKMLLPPFGGSASVWNTALVFFQVNLLLGYWIAHLLARLNSRHHKLIQSVLVVLPLLTLPVVVPSFLETQTLAPALAVLIALTLMVGAPFFALSTSTPTLQGWFAHSDHPRAKDPYFLYALSNVGSVVGLFGYPLVIERFFPIRTQAILWTAGYAVFAILVVCATWLVGKWEPISKRPVTRPAFDRRFKWAAIAFVPSLALLGVTRHLSTDVAAFPLMWTIPLAIYLASFVATFRDGGAAWTNAGAMLIRVVAVPAALVGFFSNTLWLNVALPLALLVGASLAAHGLVYKDRPDSASLTDFYLWVSIGGAVGGLFASLIAPTLFDFIIEYPLSIVLAATLATTALRSRSPDRRLVLTVVVGALLVAAIAGEAQAQVAGFAVAGLVAMLWLETRWFAVAMGALLLAMQFAGTGGTVASERTFFGVYRVHEAPGFRYIMSGSTFHGMQLTEEPDRQLPVSYYHREGPVGEVFASLPDRARSVGVIGLGVGGLTPYGDIDDHFIYYEIDQVVEDLARDDRYFTLLSDAEPRVDVVIGDGRIELERLQPKHDLLVVDAFASDSIPIHLLTLEAFQSYVRSLTPDGVLLVHISNRHLDLEPIVGRIINELDIDARVRVYEPPAGTEWAVKSIWVLIQRQSLIDLPPEWHLPRVSESLWTDDFSNILSVIKWN